MKIKLLRASTTAKKSSLRQPCRPLIFSDFQLICVSEFREK